MEGKPTEPAAEKKAAVPITGSQPVLATDHDERLRRLERRLGIRTYAGTAALVLALAAAIVAVVLAVDARDNSASKTDLRGVEREISGVADQAGGVDQLRTDIDSLDSRIAALEDDLSSNSAGDRDTAKRLGVTESDIEDLRQQISALRNSSSGSGSGSASGRGSG